MKMPPKKIDPNPCRACELREERDGPCPACAALSVAPAPVAGDELPYRSMDEGDLEMRIQRIKYGARDGTEVVLVKDLREMFRGMLLVPANTKAVARVDAGDDGYYAEILPDRDVELGQLLYAGPRPSPPVQEGPKVVGADAKFDGLRPCPFCKTAEHAAVFTSSQIAACDPDNDHCNGCGANTAHDEGVTVVCDAQDGGCGAMCGYKSTRGLAISAWNASAIASKAGMVMVSRSWLSLARCPDSMCDNNGTTAVESVAVEAGCCGNPRSNGECCGNAIPVPVQTIEPAPCQWCYERQSRLAPAQSIPAAIDEEGGKHG